MVNRNIMSVVLLVVLTISVFVVVTATSTLTAKGRFTCVVVKVCCVTGMSLTSAVRMKV